MSQFVVEDLERTLAPFRGDASAILRALHATQSELTFVPDSALDVIAKTCNVSRAEVYGVFTFYSDFRRTPPAACVVKVCVAEACQANGSREVVAALKSKGFDVHTGKAVDGVQVEQAFCLGNCALGPAAYVNGHPVGRATADSILATAREVTQK